MLVVQDEIFLFRNFVMYSDLCRLCLSPGVDSVDIFGETGKESQVSLKLSLCFNYQVRRPVVGKKYVGVECNEIFVKKH